MNIQIPLFLAITFLLISCGPKTITPTSELHDKVMVVHDDVMPKMKDIYKLKKSLRKINKNKNDENILDAINDLTKADDEMMDWMAEYDKPKEHSDESIAYLNEEMVKIKAVQKSMLMAIENAQNIVDAQ